MDTLVATLQLLARIAASGEEGARAAWARMSDPPRDASVGWDHLVAALVGYDRKFTEDDRVKRQGQAAHAGGGGRGANAIEFGVNAYGAGGDFGGGPGGGHRLASNAATNPGGSSGSSDAPFEPVPEADARGLEAYLRAVSSVVSGAAPAETRRLVAWFDARCGGVSFLDLLARTRSRPEVPAPVKAAVLDVFAAVGGSSATAAEEAWARLEAANEETTFSRGFSGGGASSGASSFGAHSGGYLGGVSGSGYYHHPGSMTHSSPAGGGSASSYGAAAMARQTDAYLQSREDARRRETAARETASLERFRGGAVDASLVRELGGAEYTSSFVGDESLGGSLADGFGGSSAGAEHFVDANDAVPRAYPHAASYVRLVNGPRGHRGVRRWARARRRRGVGGAVPIRPRRRLRAARDATAREPDGALVDGARRHHALPAPPRDFRRRGVPGGGVPIDGSRRIDDGRRRGGGPRRVGPRR